MSVKKVQHNNKGTFESEIKIIMKEIGLDISNMTNKLKFHKERLKSVINENVN
jgi:hypothetical protein